MPGVNLAAGAKDWENDYRVPDAVVFLAGTAAENHDAFWTGAADFVVEITSPPTPHPEISLYSRLGVREVLIFNRQTRVLELYRPQDGELREAGTSSLARSKRLLSSQVLPLDFRLIPGADRPQVEAHHRTTAERWVV